LTGRGEGFSGLNKVRGEILNGSTTGNRVGVSSVSWDNKGTGRRVDCNLIKRIGKLNQREAPRPREREGGVINGGHITSFILGTVELSQEKRKA